MSRKQPLVTQHLEKISRDMLEDYLDIIRGYIKNREGVYALYRRGKLHYVGLASNLMRRLKQHLKDRHGQSWDRFSIYLTIGDQHMKELESLILRIVNPPGNKVQGKFSKSENLKNKIRRDINVRLREERDRLLGKRAPRRKAAPAKRPRRVKAKKAGRTPVLAPFVKQLAGQVLKATYKGTTYRARVRKDGSISHKGVVYTSPSLAANAAQPHARNGWSFWKYERSPGYWVKLDSLRK